MINSGSYLTLSSLSRLLYPLHPPLMPWQFWMGLRSVAQQTLNMKLVSALSSLMEESVAHPPQSRGASFISLSPPHQYFNTVVSKITQESLERTNPQSWRLSILNTIPQKFLIMQRQVIPSYPFILCTCVKESGKKANHMRHPQACYNCNKGEKRYSIY